jgi:VanZ family protein
VDFQSIPLDAAWNDFRTSILASPSSRISRSDVLANVLLFVPIGFTMAGSLLLDRHRRFIVRAVAVILPVSVAISLVSEFLQTFVAGRVPSRIDVASQTAGCLIGVGAWAVVGDSVTAWGRETLAATRGNRLPRILAAYVVGWILVNLVPFDITLDMSDLVARIRSGQIAFLPVAGPDFSSRRFAWDAFAEFVSAAPLGALWVAASHGGRRRSLVAAFCLGAVIVTIVEMLQVFVASHSANAADVLFGWAGVGAGVLISTTQPRDDVREVSTGGVRLPAIAATAFWLVVLCVYHWLPFDFAFDAGAIRGKLANISLLPFGGYRSGSDLRALSTLITKLALALPLGICFALVSRHAALSRKIVIGAWLLAAAVIFGAIEAGQMFLPTRVPDPTDVLIGVIGVYAGFSLASWLER